MPHGMWYLSSPTGGRTHPSALKVWNLNDWTSRKSLKTLLLLLLKSVVKNMGSGVKSWLLLLTGCVTSNTFLALLCRQFLHFYKERKNINAF